MDEYLKVGFDYYPKMLELKVCYPNFVRNSERDTFFQKKMKVHRLNLRSPSK